MDPSLAVWVHDVDPSIAPGLPALLGERARIDPAGTIYFKIGPADTDWALTPGGGGVPSAPGDATYWVSSANATLTAEVNMGALASGIIYQTVALGVSTPAIVTIGTGLAFAAPTLSLSSNMLAGTFITQTPNADLSNEQALSLLATGVMQSTTATGVVSTFPVGTGLIPYGAAGTSLLATVSTFGYNATNATLAIGVAPASADATARIHTKSSVAGATSVVVENTDGGINSYASLFFRNDAGLTGYLYYTSSGYTALDASPNSFTIYTDPAGGGVTMSPHGVQSMYWDGSGDTLLPKNGDQSIIKTTSGSLKLSVPSGGGVIDLPDTNLRLSKGAAQTIFKSTAGTFYIGTGPGAVDLALYTADIERIYIRGAGSIDILSLVAGGLVKATATGGYGRLGIASASDVAGAITWPSGNRVLYTDATTGPPLGTDGVLIDAANDSLFIAQDGTQVWRNLGAIGVANYEQVRAFWSGNVWTLKSEEGGTGTVRSMTINADTATLTLNATTVAVTGADISAIGTNSTFLGNSWAGWGSSVNGAVGTAQKTVASAAGAVLDSISIQGNAIITGTTSITTATGFNATVFPRPQYTTTGGGVTVTSAASVYIENSPSPGANVTITNAYAFWVDTGLARFDGNGTQVWELPADATAGIDVTIDGRIPILVGGATKYIRYYND